ncbi:MAG: efflux RND transporter periplasmic adaptor subunit [Campylobacter sp.]|nr:efflux RND transporter periplasmic adaptor subunit [Campylobacter sp.]
MIKQALICSSCLLFLAGCSQSGDEMAGSASGGQNTSVPVGVFIAKMADEPIELEYPARIVSNQDVNIVAKVSGTLEEQYFKPGDQVDKGEVLFLIEPDKYQAAYDIAAANVSLSKANFEKARLDYNRAVKLKNTNSISQQEFDNASAVYRTTQAAIQSSEAALKNASVDLNYTKVVAPFSGVLGDPFVDVGTYVAPGANANLVRLTKLDPVYAEFAIPDIDALKIAEKKKANEWEQEGSKITLKMGNREYNGTVTFIDKVLNEKTGSIDAKAEFSNIDGLLLPDSFARVKMGGLYQKDGFKIPQVSVLIDLSDPFVYVVKDGVASKQIVKVAVETGEFSIISEGLKDGDQIIVDNLQKLQAGTPVNVVEEVK